MQLGRQMLRSRTMIGVGSNSDRLLPSARNDRLDRSSSQIASLGGTLTVLLLIFEGSQLRPGEP